MKQECYRYILNNRISGFQHPTRENIMGLLWAVQHDSGTVREKVRRYFAELNGEHGVLNENDLTNLRYTLVNDCFYFCEYLLSNNVDNELVYNTSDYYINQISGIRTQEEAMQFFEELSEAFFDLLAKKRLTTYTFHVEKSIRYIEQKLYTQLTLAEVAAAVGLTPQYLTTLFRQETGQTLYRYIREKKIEEARMMLLYTAEPVTTIASSLGYGSSAHFSYAFQAAVGCPPSEYRNRRSEMFAEWAHSRPV